MKKYGQLIPYVATIFLVALMTGIAELFTEAEIIFPEIAALAVGYMVAPKRSWEVNGRRMLALITVCALLGLMIVRFAKLDIYLEIIIAFTISQVLFMYSSTTFAPFVSAIVLPVMLQTTSIIYPVAAFILTLAVILFHKLFLYLGIRNDEDYFPAMLNSNNDKIDTVLRIFCIAIIGFVALYSGFKYVIAPPLLVAFTEFSRPRNKARNKPGYTVAILTGCALVGSISRYIVVNLIDSHITFAAVIATTIMLLIVHYSRMYMPPVGAITILSMIIPEETLITFPLQIFVGSSIIMTITRILFMSRQDKRQFETNHLLNIQ